MRCHSHAGCCRDMGLSAHAIISGGTDYPHDPEGFLRCVAVSRDAPEHMRSRSPEWSALVDHWQELIDLVESERDSGRAPRTYARMRELCSPGMAVGAEKRADPRMLMPQKGGRGHGHGNGNMFGAP